MPFKICNFSLKVGSHRGYELHRPPSLLVKNLVGTIEGSLPNLHRWQ